MNDHCKHNKLEAISRIVKSKIANGSVEIGGIEANEWMLSMRPEDLKYGFFIGRIYKCLECGAELVIQNMYEKE